MIHSDIATLQIVDQIAILTIANGKKNLLTEPEIIEHSAFLAWFAEHPNLRGLVIHGEGRHFSHGADVSLFSDQKAMAEVEAKLEKAKKLLNAIENLPIVTVAAINGACFGGGLEIALSCQFRICSEHAYFGLPEVSHGVIPGMNGIERITRLLGKTRAVEMCLSGEIMNAEDALRDGLVTRVVPEKDALDASLAWIRELTEGKSIAQIHHIIETINLTLQGEQNPSKGRFGNLIQRAKDE